jgi:hypothetical protein
MSSLAVSSWRRTVFIGATVFVLATADISSMQSANAAPVVSRITDTGLSASHDGTASFTLANWGGCWRCGGFAGFGRPVFFHRPFFFHPFFARPLFFHRPFFVRDRFFFFP